MKFVIDGVLLREIMSDFLLSQYSVIMLDEVYERTFYIDIMIGFLKKIKKKRKDFRIIIFFVTFDVEMFRDFFNINIINDRNKDIVVILLVKGRFYFVDVYYILSFVFDYLKVIIDIVMGIYKEEFYGDIFAFVIGQEEVEIVVLQLIDRVKVLRKGS